MSHSSLNGYELELNDGGGWYYMKNPFSTGFLLQP